MRRGLEVELVGFGQPQDVLGDDPRDADLPEVDLVAQDQRDEQVEGSVEDVEVDAEPVERAAADGTRVGCPSPARPSRARHADALTRRAAGRTAGCRGRRCRSVGGRSNGVPSGSVAAEPREVVAVGRRAVGFCASALGAEAGGDHRDGHLALEPLVDHGAEDDVGVVVGRAALISPAASLTSYSDRSLPPVMLSRMPRAPLIEVSSSGELDGLAGRLVGARSRRAACRCP